MAARRLAAEQLPAPSRGDDARGSQATAEEARTDELTGLPNRRALLEELDQRLADDATFTLTLADLNGFKRYNDTFGHPAGDALLKRLGRKLAAACEGRGIAARLGGTSSVSCSTPGPPSPTPNGSSARR